MMLCFYSFCLGEMSDCTPVHFPVRSAGEDEVLHGHSPSAEPQKGKFAQMANWQQDM